MNSNSTHKVVVGIGLAAVLGVGVSVFAVRAKHDSDIARNAPAPTVLAPSDQSASEAAASDQSAAAQSSTDETSPSAAPVVGATPIAPSTPSTSNVANDAAGAPVIDETKPPRSKASDRADRRAAKMRNSGDAGTRIASAANSNDSADERAANSSDNMSNNEPTPASSSSHTMSSAPAGASVDARQDSAQAAQEAAITSGPAATSIEPLASDSQITAYVRSEIATAAPNSNINVTTTNGVVALTGSVSSQDAVDQARRAAQRVPGVKQVDDSALMVAKSIAAAAFAKGPVWRSPRPSVLLIHG